MALVLGLIGLLAAFFLPMGNKLREAKQIDETRAKLQVIEAALTRFVMLNHRLPCPANGTLDDSDANAGLEQSSGSGGCTATNQGVIPWRTLGLTANDAADAWNTRVTYRVYANAIASLTATAGPPCGGDTPPFLDSKSASGWEIFLKTCPAGPFGGPPFGGPPFGGPPFGGPPFGGPPFGSTSNIGFRVDGDVSNSGCTKLLAQPSNGTAPNSGVAYVLISHGPNRCGGYTRSGVYIATCAGSAGMSAAEQNNRNNNGPLYAAGACYKDGDPQDNGFDDIVLWRTIMQVAVDAKKVS